MSARSDSDAFRSGAEAGHSPNAACEPRHSPGECPWCDQAGFDDHQIYELTEAQRRALNGERASAAPRRHDPTNPDCSYRDAWSANEATDYCTCPPKDEPIAWFGGYRGAVAIETRLLHLIQDDGTTFCREPGILADATKRNIGHANWCDVCVRECQKVRRDV